MFSLYSTVNVKYLFWNNGENEVASTVTSSEVQLDLPMAIL